MTRDDFPANDKYIRVMPDYASNGIWHRQGIHAEPDELPISKSLHEWLAAWANRYDINDDFLPESERKNRLDWSEFTSEGLAIARAIKAELPDWTVVWWDEQKLAEAMRSVSGERPSRRLFEFEVLVDGTLSEIPKVD